jgi:ferredoxin-NADP reductase
LQIPDYAGNNFFNTIGNLISDPRIGLLFVDFETGALLHITGRASIDWQPHNAHYAGAQRLINVEVDTVIDRPQAISLRWTKREAQLPNLKLIAREKESTYITSFYFSRADGQDLKPFEAGQHLPIEVQIPGQTGISKRSYSLSGSPKHLSYYRLSVKRENKGLVSSFLHDALHPGSTIKAQQPSDGFVIPCHTCPLVLVSAGVGQTPMLSMLYSTAEQESSVWYIHGTRNGANHALHEEVSQLVELNANLRKKIFYSQPDESDVLGRDYDIEGRITAEYLRTLNAGADTHYMLCGPMTFLADLRNGLDAAGVPESQIHFETFGSGS